MRTTAATFPYERTEEGDDAGLVFPKGTVTTIVGQVLRIDLGWAGIVRCRLQTSIGAMTVTGNRDSLSLDAKSGDWLRVHVMRRHSEPDALHVLNSTQTSPKSSCLWMPTSECHREAHLRRLRALLEKLEPAIQALFAVALCDGQQRQFFWRVAASDHHGYPGGLFDQSVRAAELAHAMEHPSHRERNLATLTALLFDIGKSLDSQLGADRPRRKVGLRPHSMTVRRLERALRAVETLDPALPTELRHLFAAPQATGLTTSTLRLAEKVHAAVLQSWDEGKLHAR